MHFTAAILSGGKATRMGGIAKGNLKTPSGETIIAHLIHEVTTAGISEIVLSANDPIFYQHYQLPIIPDKYFDYGPLAGIASVMEHLAALCVTSTSSLSQSTSILFLPCDLPNISSSIISLLLTTYTAPSLSTPLVYLATPIRSHPLCAVISGALLPDLLLAISQRELKIERLWQKLGAQKLLLSANCEVFLHNVNY